MLYVCVMLSTTKKQGEDDNKNEHNIFYKYTNKNYNIYNMILKNVNIINDTLN
jgi:hypothetical protein